MNTASSTMASEDQRNREMFELTVVGDNTGSMGEACRSARESFAEIKALVSLLVNRPAVRLAVYGDYDNATPDRAQGGHAVLPADCSADAQDAWLSKYMKPCGGGGQPEAIVTSLNFHIRETSHGPKVMFIFTDAPPHDHAGGSLDSEGRQEAAFLKEHGMISDWKELGEAVREHGFHTFVFLTGGASSLSHTYSKLGTVITVRSNSAEAITKTMMETFYALIGDLDKPGIEPICKIDLKAMLQRAKPEDVLPTFETLLNPSCADQAMCLVTNPILGRYWRLICGKFKLGYDGVYSQRCQAVMDKLSACKTKLTGQKAELLKKWIDESHNDTEFIRTIITKAGFSVTEAIPCLSLPSELRHTISLDDVLLLGRTGECKELSKLIASMEAVQMVPKLPSNEEESPDFVPLSGISPSITFRMIANLVSPGLLFSDTVAHLAAILALRNNILHDLAHRFLMDKRGKWINFDMDDTQEDTPKHPLFFVLGIHRIFASAPDEIFTTDEIAFRDHYLAVARISRNVEVPLSIVVPVAYTDLRDGPTFRRHCTGCGFDRCFTLYPGDNENCVFCTSCDPTPDHSEPSDWAHWAQCRTCHVNYAVLHKELLNVVPKCHYCRAGISVPSSSCRLCKGKYVDQGGAAMLAMQRASGDVQGEGAERLRTASENNEFVCPRCVKCPSDMVTTVNAKISELIKQNSELASLVPLSSYETLMDTRVKLWKRTIKLKTVYHKAPDIKTLQFNGFEVHVPSAVVDQITHALSNHSGVEMCSLCASDVPLHNMVEACGNCQNRICRNCSRDWYSMSKIGGLVTRAHTLCPFCKKTPKHRLIRNITLGYMRNVRPKEGRALCAWDSNMIHALCQDCMMVKEFCERDCAQETEPDIRNFRCEECRAAKAGSSVTEVVTKDCPACKVAVEKLGGCNHITCHCGSHWCWHCGKDADETHGVFDSTTVYDHMQNCGGVFPEGDDYGSEDED
eukprot:TRINITY_DN107316_c0_g1_i1.p1 TRINITY_DN107316_c0_g1~~TRINITY_DN107316_c0_g1_i1.p1  ORF type:complete len:969 (+),score=155.03 TRINITY_DN107316_c0_g1_i1:16-2922(+)